MGIVSSYVKGVVDKYTLPDFLLSSEKNNVIREAASAIKDAIIRSRYQAARLVNRELLSLYYGVGKFVSENSRGGYWGKSAIKQLSDDLQRELPGLRGFSESSIKRMRQFYEEWEPVFGNRPLIMGEIENSSKTKNRPSSTGELELASVIENFIDLSLFPRQLDNFALPHFSAADFIKVGFTHHAEILAKEKSFDGRLFYVAQCAAEFWSVEALKSNLRGDLFSKKGSLPSNFLRTLPEPEQARRAIGAFNY
jgi:hypothetical protein